MIPLALVDSYGSLMDTLTVQSLVDLERVMGSVADESPSMKRQAVMDLLPLLGNQYVGMSSLISAQFFTELQQYLEVKRPIDAESFTSAEPGRWQGLAGWAARPAALEQGGNALMFTLLSGGMTRILAEIAADTMIGNAELQGGMRFQRVPRAGCCAFCGMLASRGADYSSRESAGQVVGRGMPLERTKGKRGGQGKGIRPRGSRRMGEKFHDFCRCKVVAVTESNGVQMQADADKYLDSYSVARDKVSEGLELKWTETKSSDGSLKRQYRWEHADHGTVSPEKKTKLIVAGMRHDLGVK